MLKTSHPFLWDRPGIPWRECWSVGSLYLPDSIASSLMGELLTHPFLQRFPSCEGDVGARHLFWILLRCGSAQVSCQLSGSQLKYSPIILTVQYFFFHQKIHFCEETVRYIYPLLGKLHILSVDRTIPMPFW